MPIGITELFFPDLEKGSRLVQNEFSLKKPLSVWNVIRRLREVVVYSIIGFETNI